MTPVVAESGQRIGLLFGSFNPVHTGHLILAEHFATRTDLTAVWLVVSPQSPFKVGNNLLPDTERLGLLHLALAGNPRLCAEEVELGLPRPSYTIATLDVLRARHPTYEFVLLMGADNLAGLPRWHEAGRIAHEIDLYVYPRPGVPLPHLPGFSRTRIMEAPLLDISATFIRQSVAAGQSIRYLVPAAVEEKILAAGYYR